MKKPCPLGYGKFRFSRKPVRDCVARRVEFSSGRGRAGGGSIGLFPRAMWSPRHLRCAFIWLAGGVLERLRKDLGTPGQDIAALFQFFDGAIAAPVVMADQMVELCDVLQVHLECFRGDEIFAQRILF